MKKTCCRFTAALLLVITSFSFIPALAEAPEAYRRSTLQRVVYMPNGNGPFHYYAQNDPVWNSTIYEAADSASQRAFGDGGCNPTALAMVVASLVPTEHLNLLGMNAARGRTFTLCTCSVNKFNCHMRHKDASHVRTTLLTGDDFASVLPLALGDYATGNNLSRYQHRLGGSRQGNNGGTSKSLFNPIADIYGLSLRISRDISEVFLTLDRRGMAIALCSGSSQLFSGGNGHYVVICAYDDAFLYVMDPFVRDKYTKDRYGLIEQIDDGILRINRSSAKKMGFGTFALFEPASAAYYASLPVFLNPYTREIASASAGGDLTAMGEM